MTKIYLIRHGEAEGNIYRLWQGITDGKIAPKGKLQIEALAERFQDVPLDAIYSSDLSRAVTTAEGLARYHQLPIVKRSDAREINCGEWENEPFGNTERDFPEQMRYFNSDPEKWHVNGAETFEECRERMDAMLRSIAELHDKGTVAVVSHGMAIRTVLSHYMGFASDEIEKLPHGDNTSVSLLVYQDGKMRVEYCNDNSHLTPELSTLMNQDWWKNGSGFDLLDLRDEPFDLTQDSLLYVKCYRDAWIAVHGTETGYVSAPYLTAARKHSRKDPQSLLKIFSGEEFIGMVDLDPDRGHLHGYGWITLLYLREEYRNQGLGVQLLGRAVRYFSKHKRKALRLHVSADNQSALSFYRKNGFVLIGTEKGILGDLLLMEKRLD